MAWEDARNTLNDPLTKVLPWAGVIKGFASSRLNKKKRRYERSLLQADIDRTQRATDQFAEDTGRGRAQLKQSMYGRGLGESSIRDTESGYYERARQRGAENLSQSLDLANQRMMLYRRQRKMNRRLGPALFLGDVISMMADVAGAASGVGFGGGGASGASQPSINYGGRYDSPAMLGAGDSYH